MKPEKFRALVNDPKRTREELERMRDNARKKGESELTSLAETALAERFPGRARTQKRTGGSTPTTVRFREEERWFSTAKEAYAWLMGKFIWDRPDILRSEDWRHEFVAKGRTARYFAQDAKLLFPNPGKTDRPHNRNMYEAIGDGWFANLNLSNDEKFKILCAFSAAAGYTFKKDWEWFVEGTEEKPWPF